MCQEPVCVRHDRCSAPYHESARTQIPTRAGFDHRLFSAPIRINIRPVVAVEILNAFGQPARNGMSGTRPQIRNAANVDPEARDAERTTAGSPCSPRSINRTH